MNKANEINLKVMSSQNLEELFCNILNEIDDRCLDVPLTQDFPYFEGIDREPDVIPILSKKTKDPLKQFMFWDNVQAATTILLMIGAFAVAFYK